MNLKLAGPVVGSTYDIIICICGYESRSSYLLDCRDDSASRKIAIGYAEGETVSFDENRKKFSERGYEFYSVPDSDYEAFIESTIRSVQTGAGAIKVLLDISCFTRLRLAQTVEALFESGPFDLEVFYSLADFSAPPLDEPGNQFLCPVTDYLSGWTGDGDKAVVLVSGLGYEQMMALGIIEHIDPYDLWLFSPTSPIVEYDDEVLKANKLLTSTVATSNVLTYPVLQGDIALAKLLSLVDVVRRDFRCILMPLGPKIFAFACMVAGCVYRDVSVWRASAGIHYQPRERSASGLTASFRVVYDRDGSEGAL